MKTQKPHYSTHTFDLSLALAPMLVSSVLNGLENIGRPIPIDHYHKPEDRRYVVMGNKYPGIRVVLTQTYIFNGTTQQAGYINRLHLIVTPQDIVRNAHGLPYDPIEIFEATLENCILVNQVIQQLCDEVGLCEIHSPDYSRPINLVPNGINSFKMSRIDYCVNRRLDEHFLVKPYIKVAKQGGYPGKMKPKTHYSESGHRAIQYPGEAKYEGATLTLSA